MEFGLHRRVRCSVQSFSALGPLLVGSALVATVPKVVAVELARRHKPLRVAAAPFAHEPGSIELLWPRALDGDAALAFLRAQVERIGRDVELRCAALAL